MKANTRMVATLALVISLFGWLAAPSIYAEKAKKARAANKGDKQAEREAKKEARQEERAAKKEERQATKGENGGDRAAKKEEREAKKEERQAKREAKQGAQGDATQSAEAGGDASARKSRRANAAGQPGADNLGGGDDPFEKQGGKRNRKAAAASATTTSDVASPEGQAVEQPAPKGRKAKAAAAAGTGSATTTPATGVSTEATNNSSTPVQTPVNASPAAIRNNVPTSSTGAATESVPSSSTGASSIGDVAPSTTGVELPEAETTAAAGTGGNNGGADQKFMKAAKHDLSMAVAALKRATADKGTHRDRAIDLTQQAVAEVDKGMAYDNQNPNDRPKDRPRKQSRNEQSPWGNGVESSPAFGAQYVAASWLAQKASAQPNMQIAKQHLQNALSNLDKASADKGGFRVNAARLVREAIREVEQGIAYDNQN